MSELEHISSQKNDVFFHIFDEIKVANARYRCESGTAFEWRANWNYVYSPIKINSIFLKNLLFFSFLHVNLYLRKYTRLHSTFYVYYLTFMI